MTRKHLQALRELRDGREVWVVERHPVTGVERRLCLRRPDRTDTIPTNAIVLVKQWRLTRVRGFSFAPDLHGNERLLVDAPPTTTGPKIDAMWVGRCDVLALVVSDLPVEVAGA